MSDKACLLFWRSWESEINHAMLKVIAWLLEVDILFEILMEVAFDLQDVLKNVNAYRIKHGCAEMCNIMYIICIYIYLNWLLTYPIHLYNQKIDIICYVGNIQIHVCYKFD